MEAVEQPRATAVTQRGDAAARAARAEDCAASLEAERDRLAEQVRALIDRIPDAKPED